MGERRGSREYEGLSTAPEKQIEENPKQQTREEVVEVDMDERLEKLSQEFGRVPTPIELEVGEKRELECTNEDFGEKVKELICEKLLEVEKESGLLVYKVRGSKKVEETVISAFARVLGEKKELKARPGLSGYTHPIVIREVSQVSRGESVRIQHGSLSLDLDEDIHMKYVFEVEAYIEPRYQSYGRKGIRRLRFIATFKDADLDRRVTSYHARDELFSRQRWEEFYKSEDWFRMRSPDEGEIGLKVQVDASSLNRARKENSAYLETQKEEGRKLIREGLRSMYSRGKYQK